MLRLLAIVGVLLTSGTSSAKSVYLNGVNIDGVTNQKFSNCTVEIDALGNVKITAKGYAVRGNSGGATAPSVPQTAIGGPPTQKYFLVTEKAAPGMTQYDIDMYINAKYVRKLLDDEQHIVMEITKYLQAGNNKIRFIARKKIGPSGRRSSSPNHYFRIVIGQGESGGRNVMITKKAVDYKRTALETKTFNNEFTLTAQ